MALKCNDKLIIYANVNHSKVCVELDEGITIPSVNHVGPNILQSTPSHAVVGCR